MPRPHAGDDGDLGGAVLVPGDALGLCHEQRPIPLVLEFGVVPRVHRHRRAVHVKLADHGHAAAELGLALALRAPDAPQPASHGKG